jgi:hypothetical protein
MALALLVMRQNNEMAYISSIGSSQFLSPDKYPLDENTQNIVLQPVL